MSTDFTDADDGTVVITKEDMEMFHVLSSAVQAAHMHLGFEYDRHLAEIGRLKEEIDQRRIECQALVEVLARKYVRRPGKFDFRPEVGAFIRVGEKT